MPGFDPTGVSEVMGGIGALGKIGFGIYQNSQANKIKPVYNKYEVSPYAQMQLGLANQFLNARMPGAQDEEKNILANQANYNSNVQRNATDSGQALALAGLSQGQTNQAFNKLGIEEAQNKQSMLQNENQALQGMTQEHDKQFQDMWQNYMFDMQRKAETRNSAWQNIFGGFNDISSGLNMMGQQKQQNQTATAIGAGVW